jgi:hypothetical protein
MIVRRFSAMEDVVGAQMERNPLVRGSLNG